MSALPFALSAACPPERWSNPFPISDLLFWWGEGEANRIQLFSRPISFWVVYFRFRKKVPDRARLIRSYFSCLVPISPNGSEQAKGICCVCPLCCHWYHVPLSVQCNRVYECVLSLVWRTFRSVHFPWVLWDVPLRTIMGVGCVLANNQSWLGRLGEDVTEGNWKSSHLDRIWPDFFVGVARWVTRWSNVNVIISYESYLVLLRARMNVCAAQCSLLNCLKLCFVRVCLYFEQILKILSILNEKSKCKFCRRIAQKSNRITFYYCNEIVSASSWILLSKSGLLYN